MTLDLPHTTNYTFQDWIKSTGDLQREAYGIDWPSFIVDGEITDEGQRAFIDRGAWAAVTEIVELAQEVGWKPWATTRHVDREKLIGEAVDVMHFLANILCMVECTGAELTSAYKEKQHRNLARQVEGYTGEKDAQGRELDRPKWINPKGPTPEHLAEIEAANELNKLKKQEASLTPEEIHILRQNEASR